MKAPLHACICVVMLGIAAAASIRLHGGPVGATLVMHPATVAACTTPVATQVEWDVRGLAEDGVKLEVNNLGRPPKLWVQSGASGRAEAGAWAHDGYTVTLKALNGRVLARRTLTTEPCSR